MRKIPTKFPFVYGITLGKYHGINVFNNYVNAGKSAADTKMEYQQDYLRSI